MSMLKAQAAAGHLSVAAKVSPEVTAARRAVVTLLGEFSAKERWIEKNINLVKTEMERLKSTGVLHQGAALRSSAVKLLYTDEIRQAFEGQPEDGDHNIAG
jgi:hypothetical protein